MTLRPMILLLLIATLASGCGSTMPDEPAPAWGPAQQIPAYQGTLESGCSPVDAPAVALELQAGQAKDDPQVSIVLWPRFPLDAGVILPLDLGQSQGMGAVFSGGTEWVPASEGELVIESYVEGSEARGWFWLQLDGGLRVEGTFHAIWQDTGPAICG